MNSPLLPVTHWFRNTLNGVWVCVCVGGEREGEMYLQVLLKNEFLSNCLLLGNTKDCSHNYLDKTKFYCVVTCGSTKCYYFLYRNAKLKKKITTTLASSKMF